jgi:hypothetical protein
VGIIGNLDDTGGVVGLVVPPRDGPVGADDDARVLVGQAGAVGRGEGKGDVPGAGRSLVRDDDGGVAGERLGVVVPVRGVLEDGVVVGQALGEGNGAGHDEGDGGDGDEECEDACGDSATVGHTYGMDWTDLGSRGRRTFILAGPLDRLS